jgi:quercetin dioxygenase-like cupin family protein
VRTTVFNVVDGRVEFKASETASWAAADESGQRAAEIYRSPNGASVLYSIPAGCTVPIHSGTNYSFCQIVTGRGKLTLPGGREIDYSAPELFILEPGALHGWSDVVEDTLLSVSDVKH